MKDKPDSGQDLSGAERLVAEGAMVMRFENADMSAFALAHRRVEAECKQLALDSLADFEAAESAYYSIPYKDHSHQGECTGRSDDGCPIGEQVEGVGIEGARDLARYWRNNASRVTFGEEDDEWVWLVGVFTDFETNTRVELPLGVSRYGVKKGGGVYSLNPRQLSIAIQAGVSKAARNAIIHGIPRHVSRAFYQRAKERIEQEAIKPLDVDKTLGMFAKYNVTREQLEGFYNSKLEDLDAPLRRNLRGLFVSIRERFVDPEQFFAGGGDAVKGPEGPTPDPPEGRTEGVASPLPGAQAEVRGGVEASTPSPSRPDPVDGPSGGESDSKAPPPSGVTPDPVESQKPNDPEPTQASLEDLGI